MKKLSNPRIWAYGLFWSWNLIFLAFMLLGFAPTILPEMNGAVQRGDIPPIFLLYAGVLTAVPLLAVLLGLTWLRREPGKLFTLGYGVEGPLMVILAVRFFLIQQATPAITFLLLAATFGALTLLWQLLDRRIDERGPALNHLRLAGLTVLLLVGLYAALWLAFYAIPLLAQSGQILGEMGRNLVYSLRNINWRDIAEGWRFIPIFLLGFPLLVYTGTLFVLMPIAVPILYGRAWWQGVQAVKRQAGAVRPALVATAVFTLCLALFIWTDRQPQQTAFALLETPPGSLEEAMTLAQQEEQIRQGLLNAYLASRRYVSSAGEMDHIRYIYEDALNLTTPQAQQVQHLYEQVARPVLYKPVNPPQPSSLNRWDNRVFPKEQQEAAELYEQFFDVPIVVGERETIVRAMRSTWMADQARAGWQAVDDREIYLTEQRVTVAEQGDWAEVELYEVYANQTGQRQEVVYYFSLPEGAVITGVWLGNGPDKAEAFPYRVAPRGAAQAVYRNEVRRNVDPALVEQIGPRQYRLRIFPIEPQTWRWEANRSSVSDGPPLHLWLNYRALRQVEGWPLPALADKRNVYWDRGTSRQINGAPMAADEATWLPAFAAAVSPAPDPTAHWTFFPDGQLVIARPATAEDIPAIPSDLRLAVILDRSRSMTRQETAVTQALDQLQEMMVAGTAVDLYLTAADVRGEKPRQIDLADLTADDLFFFGGQNAADLLRQFSSLYDGQPYDAILLLTDESGYRVDKGETAVIIPDAPLWLVHLGGHFPLGYDDGTLEAIQASGGGVAASIEEALTRLAVAQAAAQSGVMADLIDGYLWQAFPADLGPSISARPANMMEYQPDAPFAAFAGRRLILAEMQRQRGSLAELDVLDDLHAIAVAQGIVTPYSSMIVLVTEQQQRLLNQLENDPDRFEREFEAMGETEGEFLTVTGVPEPEEWLLIILAVGLLFWYLRGRRPQFVVP